MKRKHSASASKCDDLADNHKTDDKDNTADESNEDKIEDKYEAVQQNKKKNSKKYKCVFAFKKYHVHIYTQDNGTSDASSNWNKCIQYIIVGNKMNQ